MPPAVVSLLARRLDRSGFGATLVDLAARGWFEVHAPAGAAGSAEDAGSLASLHAARWRPTSR